MLHSTETLCKHAYEYIEIFHGCKNDNFQMKNCDTFLIFAQNLKDNINYFAMNIHVLELLTIYFKDNENCSLLNIYNRKVPKFLGARNLCCNLPKIQIKRPNLKGILSNGANGIANSEDPD